MKLRLLLVGASGAVGNAVLTQALGDARIAQVVAPTRRPLGVDHPKLGNPVVDFTELPDADWWACDAVVCTLGTTIRQAGSQAAFAVIDRDLPIDVGRRAKRQGATSYALNSSLGASLTGNFYLRTKAEAEQGIIDLGFRRTVIVRPSLIDTTREQARPAEAVGILAARLFKPLIPRQYRMVTPDQIATALLAGVLSDRSGVTIIESADLQPT